MDWGQGCGSSSVPAPGDLPSKTKKNYSNAGGLAQAGEGRGGGARRSLITALFRINMDNIIVPISDLPTVMRITLSL